MLNTDESQGSIEANAIIQHTKPMKRHQVEERPQMSMWDLMVLYDSNKKRMEDKEA